MSHPGHPGSGQDWYPQQVLITSPMAMGAATNNQLLIGTNDGHVYAYNVLSRAVTMLEDVPVVSTGLLSWVGSFNGVRMVAWDISDSQTEISYWDGDNAVTDRSASLEGSAWDFDLPENVKLIEGFHVVSEKPTVSKTIQISYQVDESGTYTVLPTLNNTNTTTGDNFIPVSSLAAGSVTSSVLRFKIAAAGGMKVYSVTAQARVMDHQEIWDLFLLCENETANSSRPRDQHHTAGQKRTMLRNLAKSKAITEFKDGYRDYRFGAESDPVGGYSVHPVIVDSIEDEINDNGGGRIHVTLKSAGSLTAAPTAAPGMEGQAVP